MELQTIALGCHPYLIVCECELWSCLVTLGIAAGLQRSALDAVAVPEE